MDLQKIIKLILVCIICVAFFLPWVAVESELVGGMTKLITGKKQSQIDSISGFRVPVMANSSESRLLISVAKIFKPDAKDLDKKSYLIWLVPLLSVGMFALSEKLKGNKWIMLGIGIVGIAIFAGATFKIVTTDLDKMVLKVNIGYGLWMILLGYLGIGIIELLGFVKGLKK